MNRCLLAALFFSLFLSCRFSQKNFPAPGNLQFELLDSVRTGIGFINALHFEKDFNIYTYRNFYNGGGVAVGDVNNDGLMDLYFTANMEKNKLYINRGDFQFEDISKSAGIEGTKSWSTGVVMVDINQDGFLDIYVCNSGDMAGDNKKNELFINDGNLHFEEKAEEYGLADEGYSTHAAFFDYDKDGDLDVYILNNSYKAIGSFNLQKNERYDRDKKGGDKLMRNDNGKFVDVSIESGIYGSVIGFGLGVTVGDVNGDGWQDIYVSNDFFERDYLYINNRDGSFTEKLTDEMLSISAASMGADMADMNNDLLPDLFVTEMLPSDPVRLKTKTTFENWDKYQFNLKNDYYHQFTRNVLQRNNGNESFSEIGRLAGVEASDWSWGALMSDFDNDGHKDLFIANGIYQDLTDQDYLNFMANEEVLRSHITDHGVDYAKLIELIPSNKVPNQFYLNQGDGTFRETADSVGLAQPGFSNGSVYADLDNDGDLDLVVNNVNMPAFVYRNSLDNSVNNYLEVKLVSDNQAFQIGAQLILSSCELNQYLENSLSRGFQSSIVTPLHFGLGQCSHIDSLTIKWNDERFQTLYDLPVNQIIEIDHKNSLPNKKGTRSATDTYFELADFIPLRHIENEYSDFDRDKLLIEMKSSEGPKLADGDINGDGLMDYYLGGSKGYSGQLIIQTQPGKFQIKRQDTFDRDKESEDGEARFFDADGDKDLDLYVTSGGNEFSNVSLELRDRLYFNDGKGNFTKSDQELPSFKTEATKAVDFADIDSDGDLDLFVGTRLEAKVYGIPMKGYLLENNGKGLFTDVTEKMAPEMLNLGLITDANFVDLDLDGDKDLVIVGEWMPVSVFENDGMGRFENKTVKWGFENTDGLYQELHVNDINGDGRPDLILGNMGLNTRLKASVRSPIELVINDFDQNGSIDQLFCQNINGRQVPLALRHDILTQLPQLKKQFVSYEEFAGKALQDIIDAQTLARSIILRVKRLDSFLALNTENNTFSISTLPKGVQVSPIFAIYALDINRDGRKDIVSGGNLFRVKPEFGRYDASFVELSIQNNDGTFSVLPATKSGFKVLGEVRDIKAYSADGRSCLLISRNNDTVLKYCLKNVD